MESMIPGAEFSAFPADSSRADLVDEFAELDRQVQLFKPKKDRHEELNKLIKSWYEDFPADKTAIAEGHCYYIRVGVKAQKRTWTSIIKLYRALKRDAFFSICEVALGKAEEILGKAKVAKLVTETQSGSRRLTPVLKKPVLQAAA
jgi:hypothetical protein